jgi:hypothetical protein
MELVKLLKSHRRKSPISGLSSEAESLMGDAHLLPTAWYPFAPVVELIQVSYRYLMRSREEAALQMGMAGGAYALGTYHKTFVKLGDPRASVLAMRHTWPLYFDFGALSASDDGNHAAVFTLEGYSDMSAAHGYMIVGWHRAAALAAGATEVRGDLLECPWSGDSSLLVHRVRFK